MQTVNIPVGKPHYIALLKSLGLVVIQEQFAFPKQGNPDLF